MNGGPNDDVDAIDLEELNQSMEELDLDTEAVEPENDFIEVTEQNGVDDTVVNAEAIGDQVIEDNDSVLERSNENEVVMEDDILVDPAQVPNGRQRSNTRPERIDRRRPFRLRDYIVDKHVLSIIGAE